MDYFRDITAGLILLLALFGFSRIASAEGLCPEQLTALQYCQEKIDAWPNLDFGYPHEVLSTNFHEIGPYSGGRMFMKCDFTYRVFAQGYWHPPAEDHSSYQYGGYKCTPCPEGGEYSETKPGECHETCEAPSQWSDAFDMCLTCGDGQEVGPAGQCIDSPCDEGEERFEGKCKPKCPPGTERNILGVCAVPPDACPPGSHDTDHGCEIDDCGPGRHPSGMYCLNDPKTCDPGMHAEGNQCVDDDDGGDGDCFPGMHREDGDCVFDKCPIGTYRIGNECISTAPCGPGTHRDLVTGACVADPPPQCPPNSTDDGTGFCAPDPKPDCGPHAHRVGYLCYDNDPPTCDAGEHSSGYTCVPDADPPKTSCSTEGTVLVDGQCVDVPPPVCGEGSHASNGECVADAPEPDIPPDDGNNDGSLPPDACGTGTHAYQGHCVADHQCGANAHVSGGACVCNAGSHRSGDSCVADNIGGDGDGKITCPDGRKVDSVSQCMCPSGTHNVGGGDVPHCEADDGGDKGTASAGGWRCDVAPACSGNPVVCAEIQQNHNLLCDDEPPALDAAVPSLDLGTKEILGSDSFDDSGFGLGTQCPAKVVSFELMSQSVEIDFTIICDYGPWLRGFILLLAAMTAIKIIGGSV